MRYKREEKIKKKFVGARVKKKVYQKIQKIKKEEGYPTIAKTLRKAINSFIRKKEVKEK